MSFDSPDGHALIDEIADAYLGLKEEFHPIREIDYPMVAIVQLLREIAHCMTDIAAHVCAHDDTETEH